ncbi:unnamed protein product [Prorocentrum cordatum]|uniref:Uncharacterized protein n=1 Tax=Prorocentrum cordatum TaxID=2364126 RepID=A0ABN9W3N3_9DINO|nr:unnamed protein product [Polarella glacialis]
MLRIGIALDGRLQLLLSLGREALVASPAGEHFPAGLAQGPSPRPGALACRKLRLCVGSGVAAQRLRADVRAAAARALLSRVRLDGARGGVASAEACGWGAPARASVAAGFVAAPRASICSSRAAVLGPATDASPRGGLLR